MRKLSMRKISELLRQRHELKRSYREIGQSLNMSISTVGDYLSRAKLSGLNWPLPEGISEEELYAKLFLPVAKAVQHRSVPDWETIVLELRRKGVTLRLLWREYRENCPDGYGYTQFCNRYNAYAKSVSPMMRQVHKAGEKIFVDYAGMTMPWIDIVTGEIHEAQTLICFMKIPHKHL